MNDFLQVTNGLFYFSEMEKYNYTPEEIFSVLSRMPRFNCHGKGDIITVGQHTLHVLSLSQNEPEIIQRHLLMHDTTECFLIDLPTPIKRLLPDYEKMEERCLKAIYSKFGFTFPTKEDLVNVKHYDKKALYIEGILLFGKESFFGDKGEENITIKAISKLTNNQVYELLMESFGKLSK